MYKNLKGARMALMSDNAIMQAVKSEGKGHDKKRINYLFEMRDKSRRELPEDVQKVIERSMQMTASYTKSKPKRHDKNSINKTVKVNIDNITDTQFRSMANNFQQKYNLDDKEKNRRMNVLRNGNRRSYTTDELKAFFKTKENEDIMLSKAEFYQKFIEGKATGTEVSNLASFEGDDLLPKKMSRDILIDYPADEALREVMTVTNIENLEQPILSYTTTDTAQELGLTGDSIKFNNTRDRIIARVSDSVVHGSASDLEKAIEDSLKNELLKKEQERIFATSPSSNEGHMSLYNNDIEEVAGEDRYNAITNALDDLPNDIRTNSSIVLSFNDFKELSKELGNMGLGALAADLERAFNVKSVVVNDKATDIVVGDFKGLHANYYAQLIDQDKDTDTGMYMFALAFTFDIRVIDKLFRVAKVEE